MRLRQSLHELLPERARYLFFPGHRLRLRRTRAGINRVTESVGRFKCLQEKRRQENVAALLLWQLETASWLPQHGQIASQHPTSHTSRRIQISRRPVFSSHFKFLSRQASSKHHSPVHYWYLHGRIGVTNRLAACRWRPQRGGRLVGYSNVHTTQRASHQT